MGSTSSPSTRAAWVLAAIQGIGGAIMWFAGAIPDTSSLVLILGLGVVFGGLAIWARKDPLTALQVGAGIWGIMLVVETAIEPASLLNGIVLKAIVVVLFVNGISTAMTDAQALTSQLLRTQFGVTRLQSRA